MIRTRHFLLPFFCCFALINTFIVCSESGDERDLTHEHSRSRSQSPAYYHNSGSEAEAEDGVEADPTITPASPFLRPLSPVRRSPSTTLTTRTSTSSATTSSFTQEEGKQPPAQIHVLSPRHSSHSSQSSNHRRSRRSSNSSTSAQQTTTSQTTSTSGTTNSAASQIGSPVLQRGNLAQNVVATTTLVLPQGSAPVARAETGFWDKVWSTAQPFVQCQRTITESSIRDNNFCEKYPTEPSRFAAISGALTELTLQAEQKLDHDYLVRAKKVLTFANQNTIPVLPKQSAALLAILQQKQREYAELERVLTSQTTQKNHAKKSRHKVQAITSDAE